MIFALFDKEATSLRSEYDAMHRSLFEEVAAHDPKQKQQESVPLWVIILVAFLFLVSICCVLTIMIRLKEWRRNRNRLSVNEKGS